MVEGKHQSYRISASSAEERDQWIEAIRYGMPSCSGRASCHFLEAPASFGPSFLSAKEDNSRISLPLLACNSLPPAPSPPGFCEHSLCQHSARRQDNSMGLVRRAEERPHVKLFAQHLTLVRAQDGAVVSVRIQSGPGKTW